MLTSLIKMTGLTQKTHRTEMHATKIMVKFRLWRATTTNKQ